mmetsp:Transcript_2894/g.5697  ORF Transcript_2894/g.5697 Transcript_2894/m.5697 type:complete len:82 (+) Transcript_2894:132-377(+)
MKEMGLDIIATAEAKALFKELHTVVGGKKGVSVSTFSAYLREEGQPISDSDKKSLLQVLDTNKDGFIPEHLFLQVSREEEE